MKLKSCLLIITLCGVLTFLAVPAHSQSLATCQITAMTGAGSSCTLLNTIPVDYEIIGPVTVTTSTPPTGCTTNPGVQLFINNLGGYGNVVITNGAYSWSGSVNLPATALSAGFAPALVAELNSSGSGCSSFVPVTVTVYYQPAISGLISNPTSLAFGNVVVGATSPSQAVIIKNTGWLDVTVSAFGVGDGTDYLVTNGVSNPCGYLPPQSSCELDVAFDPQSTGSLPTTLTVVSTAGNSPLVLNITGTGVAAVPMAAITPMSVPFGNQQENTTSFPRTVTLENTGTSSLTITSITLADTTHFTKTSTCGGSLSPLASCTVNLTFTPATTTTYTTTLTFVTNDPINPTQVVSVTGTGVNDFVKLTSTSIMDLNNIVLAQGMMTIIPTNAADVPINFNAGGNGGQVNWRGVGCNIVNGALVQPCIIPNSALSFPMNVGLRMTWKDTSNNQPLGNYKMVQTADNTTDTNHWCTSAVCNFDLYQYPQTALALIQTGPPGVGVPAGGTATQVLTKNSPTDYDDSWANPTGGGGGGLGDPGASGIVFRTSVVNTTRIATATDVMALILGGSAAQYQTTYWYDSTHITGVGPGSSGTCYMSNGSGSAPSFQTCPSSSGGGNVSNSGSPAAHQVAVWVTSTTVEGITPGSSGQCFMSNGTSSDPTFQTCPSGSGGGNMNNSGSPVQYQTSVFVDATHIEGIGPGTASYVWTSNGSGSYPSWQPASGSSTATGVQVTTCNPSSYAQGSIWFDACFNITKVGLSSSTYQRLATMAQMTGFNHWQNNYVGNLIAQADAGITVHGIGIVIGDSTIAGSNVTAAPVTNETTSYTQELNTVGTTAPKLAELIEARFGKVSGNTGYGGAGWIPTYTAMTTGGQGTPNGTTVALLNNPTDWTFTAHDGTASFCPDDTKSYDATVNDTVTYTDSNTTSMTFYALGITNGAQVECKMDSGSYGSAWATSGSSTLVTNAACTFNSLTPNTTHTLVVKITTLGSGSTGAAFCGVRSQNTTQSATFEVEKWGSGGAELRQWNDIPNGVLTSLSIDPSFVAIESGPNEYCNADQTPTQMAASFATAKGKVNTVWPDAAVIYIQSQKDYRTFSGGSCGSSNTFAFDAYAKAIQEEATLDGVTLIDLYDQTANGPQLTNWTLCPYAGASSGNCYGVHMNDPGNDWLAATAYNQAFALYGAASTVSFGNVGAGNNTSYLGMGAGGHFDLDQGCDPGTCFKLAMDTSNFAINPGYVSFDNNTSVDQMVIGRGTTGPWRIPYFGSTNPTAGNCISAFSSNGQLGDDGQPCNLSPTDQQTSTTFSCSQLAGNLIYAQTLASPTYTLPSAACASGVSFGILNMGSGTITISSTTIGINGGTTGYTLANGNWNLLYSDGSSWKKLGADSTTSSGGSYTFTAPLVNVSGTVKLEDQNGNSVTNVPNLLDGDVTLTFSSSTSDITTTIDTPSANSFYECGFTASQTANDSCTTQGAFGIEVNYTDSSSSTAVSGSDNVGWRSAGQTTFTTCCIAAVTTATTLSASTAWYSFPQYLAYDKASDAITFVLHITTQANCTTYPIYKVHYSCRK